MEQNESILEDINVAETEAPYGQRFLANLLDWIIEIAIMVGFYFLMPRDFITNLFTETPFMKYVVAIVLMLSYRFVCILATGRTIGMAICKIKYLNSNQEPLSATEKLTAVTIKTAGIKYYKA